VIWSVILWVSFGFMIGAVVGAAVLYYAEGGPVEGRVRNGGSKPYTGTPRPETTPRGQRWCG
jgi:hypothetical protein